MVETDSQYATLCQGDQAGDALDMMTDSEELLAAGIAVAQRAWKRFLAGTAWEPAGIDRVITHQVGRAHSQALFSTLGLDPKLDFSSFETLGNVGSVSCPMTLAQAIEAGAYAPGERAALLGIGSGLSCLMMAVEWPKHD